MCSKWNIISVPALCNFAALHLFAPDSDRPSVQPNSASPCVNPESQPFASNSFSSDGMSTPRRRMRSLCCARTASGHAAAPASPAMNSRRRIRYPLIGSIAYSGRGCMSRSRDPGLSIFFAVRAAAPGPTPKSRYVRLKSAIRHLADVSS